MIEKVLEGQPLLKAEKTPPEKKKRKKISVFDAMRTLRTEEEIQDYLNRYAEDIRQAALENPGDFVEYFREIALKEPSKLASMNVAYAGRSCFYDDDPIKKIWEKAAGTPIHGTKKDKETPFHQKER